MDLVLSFNQHKIVVLAYAAKLTSTKNVQNIR